MTQIVGIIADSAGQPLSGVLQVTLDTPMTIADETLTMFGVDFPIAADGIVNIDLPPSDINQTTYHLVFKTLASGEIPERVWLDFHAQVPTSAGSVLLVDLLPTTLVTDVMDTSVIRLAKYITDEPILLAKVRSSFNGRGTWNLTQLYYKDDVVIYDGASYFYTNKVPTIGTPLSNTTYWQPLALKGSTGSGTTGNSTPYDATTWNTQTDAPSRGAVRDLVENILAKNTDYAGLAPLANPAFTGIATVVSPSNTDSTTQIPNTLWVNTNFIRQDTPALITNPPSGSSNLSIASTAWVNAAITSAGGFGGGGGATVSDLSYNATSWDGVGTVAPSQNAVRDIVELLARRASPTFTGVPTAPTATSGTNTTQLATTAFVAAAVAGLGGASVSDLAYNATTWDGVTTVAPSKNAVRDIIATLSSSLSSYATTAFLTANYPTNSTLTTTLANYVTSSGLTSALTPYATLANPSFTGVPVCPVPSAGDNSPQLANTQWVNTKLVNYATTSSLSSYVTSSSLATTLGAYATTGSLSIYATLANPTFTGSVTVPTQLNSDSSSLAANTAWVTTKLAGYLSTGSLTGYAPLANPTFTGAVVVPTQLSSDNSTLAANTAWVTDKLTTLAATIPTISDAVYDSTAWNAVGTIAPSKNAVRDIITTLAPRANPVLTGTVTIPTPITSDNSTAAASTAYVTAKLADYATTASLGSYVTTSALSSTLTGYTTTGALSSALTPYATLANPTFTGTVSAPTAIGGDNTTKVATTQWVTTALGSYVTTGALTTTLNGYTTNSNLSSTLSGYATNSALAAVVSDTAYNAATWDAVTGIAPSKNAVRDQLELLAPIANPALTGVPTAPTATVGTNTTQIATTAFVLANVGSAGYSVTPNGILYATPAVIVPKSDIVALAPSLFLANSWNDDSGNSRHFTLKSGGQVYDSGVNSNTLSLNLVQGIDGRNVMQIPFLASAAVIGTDIAVCGSAGSTFYFVHKFDFTNIDVNGWQSTTNGGSMAYQWGMATRWGIGLNGHTNLREPAWPRYEWCLTSYHVSNLGGNTIKAQLAINNKLAYDTSFGSYTTSTGSYFRFEGANGGGVYSFGTLIVFPNYISFGSSDHNKVVRYLKNTYPSLYFAAP